MFFVDVKSSYNLLFETFHSILFYLRIYYNFSKAVSKGTNNLKNLSIVFHNFAQMHSNISRNFDSNIWIYPIWNCIYKPKYDYFQHFNQNC